MADKKPHTPAFKIFHYYYQCQVPQHFLYSKEYVDTFGLPTTGDSEIDRELSQSLVPAQLTIAEMAEALDDGVNIILTDPKEAATIYGIIYDHLEGWRKQVTGGMSGLEPPVEDLRKLDVLAKEVYKVGRSYLPDPKEKSSILRSISRLSQGSAGRPRPQAPKPTAETLGEHKPISELIAKETFNRRSRWR